MTQLLRNGLIAALLVSVASVGNAGLSSLKRDGAYWFELEATGYILGEVHEIVHVPNIPPFNSYEGVMHVGGEGGPIYIEGPAQRPASRSQSATDTPPEEIIENGIIKTLVSPLQFSINNRNYERSKQTQGLLSLTKYIQRKHKSPFLETAREWENSILAPGTRFKPLRWEVNRGSNGWGDKGTFSGRIVHLTYQGSLLKSWEAVIQRGHKASGRSFVTMSIREESLARYALATMHSGLTVRFYYTQPAKDGLIWKPLDKFWRPIMDASLRLLPETDSDIWQIEQLSPAEEEAHEQVRLAKGGPELRVVDENAFLDNTIDLLEYLNQPPHSTPSKQPVEMIPVAGEANESAESLRAGP